jgi:sugar lactone lactonase YvrE
MKIYRFMTLLLLGSCAAGPATFLRRPEGQISWPIYDPEPRVSVLYTYHDLLDTDRSPGFWRSLGNFVMGEDYLALSAPYGMALAVDDETLWIADTSQGALHRLSLVSGDHQRFFAQELRPLLTPVGVAILPGSRVAVADSTRAEIVIFDQDGVEIYRFGSPSELGRPTGLCWDDFGHRLLIVDTVGGRILAYSAGGEFMSQGGLSGEKPGEFNFPTNVTTSVDGRVFVTDSLNFRVQILSENLQPILNFGIAGDGPGTFSKAKGIALDSEGHIYVVDAMFDNVQVFDQQGQLLLTFGNSGGGYGGFSLPAGIFIDRFDRIYVSDQGNSRIQVFQYYRTIEP